MSNHHEEVPLGRESSLKQFGLRLEGGRRGEGGREGRGGRGRGGERKEGEEEGGKGKGEEEGRGGDMAMSKISFDFCAIEWMHTLTYTHTQT